MDDEEITEKLAEVAALRGDIAEMVRQEYREVEQRAIEMGAVALRHVGTRMERTEDGGITVHNDWEAAVPKDANR